MERLPFENILYFGDTARVPYGIKSVETINRYAAQITEFLIQKNVKMLIVACNTMAAVAHQTIADLSPVPVLEVIHASARMAVQNTKNKSVGVIGTPATINSNAYARAIHLLDRETKVFSQACPLFVPLVEEGWFEPDFDDTQWDTSAPGLAWDDQGYPVYTGAGWYRATTGGGEDRVQRQTATFLAQTYRQLAGSQPVYFIWAATGGDWEFIEGNLAGLQIADSRLQI